MIAGGVVLLVIGILNGLSLYWGQAKYLRGIAPPGGLPPEARLELARSSPIVFIAYVCNTGFGIILGALWGACAALATLVKKNTWPPRRFFRPGMSPRASSLAFHLSSFSSFLVPGLLFFLLAWKKYLLTRPQAGEFAMGVAFLLVVYLALSYGLYRVLSPLVFLLAQLRPLRILARPRTGLVAFLAVSAVVAIGSFAQLALVTHQGPPAPQPPGPVPVRAPSGAPHVLLLVLDTTRADHLSCYGYPKPTTPHLDRLAAEGVLYERAYSPAVWTLAGHAAMFTGQYSSRNGAHEEHLYLDHGATTLAEVLASAGYRTAGFSNNAWVSEWTGLGQGFEEMRQVWTRPYNAQFVIAAMVVNFLQFATTGNAAVGGVVRTNEAVLSWIDEATRDGRPFFCFVNYMEAHPPLDYRARFTEPFRPEALPVSKVARVNQNPYAVWARKITMTAEDSLAYSTLYDGELNYLDAHLKNLFEGLGRRGLLDKTIIIVTADHGEAVGEHGDLGHHLYLWEGILRVPLIVRYPRPSRRVSG